MLKTYQLSHAYAGDQKFDFPDINCNSDETLLVLGNSGVGKTTLLHILAGILKPLHGNVMLAGTSIYGLSGRKLDVYRGNNIGLVFQKPHFVQSITAEENLLLAQKVSGRSSDRNSVKRIMEKLDIYRRKSAKAYQMSQGEQQRLSIARALINQPKLILADEPSSALDDVNCNKVIQLLQEQSSEVNAALVIVTHDNRLKDIFSNYIVLN